MMIATNAPDDATKTHVDGSSKKSWAEKDEDALDRVRHNPAGLVVRRCSSAVSSELD